MLSFADVERARGLIEEQVKDGNLLRSLRDPALSVLGLTIRWYGDTIGGLDREAADRLRLEVVAHLEARMRARAATLREMGILEEVDGG